MTNVTNPNVTGIEDFNMTNVTNPNVTGIEDFNVTNVTKPNVTGIEDFNMTNDTLVDLKENLINSSLSLDRQVPQETKNI